MNIVDCPWELNNIGKKTVEVNVQPEDSFDRTIISDIEKLYEYVVVKVPMNKIPFNKGLSEMGYCLMEVQKNISKEVSRFDYNNSLYKDVFFSRVTSSEDVLNVKESLTVDMFSTDRVSLDPCLGASCGRKRYLNWLMSEMEHGKSIVVNIHLGTETIGFMMYRITESFFYLLLNGLYRKWQGKHLGIITPSSPFLLIKQENMCIDKVLTSISSNNIPVVKLYNKLNFKIESETYVFVKHN